MQCLCHAIEMHCLQKVNHFEPQISDRGDKKRKEESKIKAIEQAVTNDR